MDAVCLSSPNSTANSEIHKTPMLSLVQSSQVLIINLTAFIKHPICCFLKPSVVRSEGLLSTACRGGGGLGMSFSITFAFSIQLVIQLSDFIERLKPNWCENKAESLILLIIRAYRREFFTKWLNRNKWRTLNWDFWNFIVVIKNGHACFPHFIVYPYDCRCTLSDGSSKLRARYFTGVNRHRIASQTPT